MRMSIGSRIKEKRKEAGLTQKGLSAKVGVEYQALQQWERGATEPRPEHRAKLAAALKTSEQYLLFGHGQQEPGKIDPRRQAIIDAAKTAPESSLDWLEIQARIALNPKVFKTGEKSKKRS